MPAPIVKPVAKPIAKNDALHRKLRLAAARSNALHPDPGGRPAPGVDQGWRLALARAARDRIGLAVEVAQLQVSRRSLAEVLELPPDRGLLALLDGPGGGLGLICLAPECFTGLVEWQTLGRLGALGPVTRRPTRTDAAMISDLIDHALTELGEGLATEPESAWAMGYRYASFLDDPRPLGLLLEDQPYHVLNAVLALGDGDRQGRILLALPAKGRAAQGAGGGASHPHAPPAAAVEPSAAPQAFAAALTHAVLGSDSCLDATLGRIRLSLRNVLELRPGDALEIPGARIEKIALSGANGVKLASARLGQHQGMRALRLTTLGADSDSPMPAPIPQVTPVSAAATGDMAGGADFRSEAGEGHPGDDQ